MHGTYPRTVCGMICLMAQDDAAGHAKVTAGQENTASDVGTVRASFSLQATVNGGFPKSGATLDEPHTSSFPVPRIGPRFRVRRRAGAAGCHRPVPGADHHRIHL